MNHKPATALPWEVRDGATIVEKERQRELAYASLLRAASPEAISNAAYIAHTANAYPELVEALRDLVVMVNETTNRGNGKAAKSAVALLAKLGEAA